MAPTKRPEELRNERESASHEIQKISKWVTTKFADGVAADPPYVAIRRKFEALEEAWKTFRRSQALLEKSDSTEITADIHEATEEAYFEAVVTLEVKLDVLNASIVSNSPGPLNNTQANPTICSTINLPKVDLKKFSGEDPTAWLGWYTKFKSLVHEKPFDKCYKFELLTQSLEGEAFRQIKDLEQTEANYDEAIKLLYRRWHNVKSLSFAHMRKIFSIETIKKPTRENLTSLVDTIRSNLRALKSLDNHVNSWEEVVVFWTLEKLDSETRLKWNDHDHSTKIPALEEVLIFVERQAQNLAMTSASKQTKPEPSKPSRYGKAMAMTDSSVKPVESETKKYKRVCNICNDHNHGTWQCKKLLSKSVSDRRIEVKKLNLCFNCLSKDHFSKDCKSRLCKICEAAHNSILCVKAEPQPISNLTNAVTATTTKPATTTGLACATAQMANRNRSMILLATAIVLLKDKHGSWVPGRAFLDDGSQFTFISESFRQRLGLPRMRSDCRIETLNGNALTQYASTVVVRSRLNNFSKTLKAVVQQKLIDLLPRETIHVSHWKIPDNIQLADPRFFEAAKIDLILSTEIISKIDAVGCISLGDTLPTLKNTLLGWTVSGPVYENPSATDGFCGAIIGEAEELDISRFWEVEDVGDVNLKGMTAKEKEIETEFLGTIIQRSDKFYEVPYPLRRPISDLGSSIEMAKNRYRYLEKKLDKLPKEASQMYHDFFKEYNDMGHMAEIPSSDYDKIKNVLPHHPIVRLDKVTTKVRAVFDASAKTSNGLSFNDIQEKGPTMQDDLFDILIRFRVPKIVLNADIEKMYRQVMIKDTHMHNVSFGKTNSIVC